MDSRLAGQEASDSGQARPAFSSDEDWGLFCARDRNVRALHQARVFSPWAMALSANDCLCCSTDSEALFYITARLRRSLTIVDTHGLCPWVSTTGLPDQSIDLAFLFGLPYIAGGLGNVISEMYRVLKPEGVLSFEKTRGSERELIQELERGGFVYSGRQARIFLFAKGEVTC